MKMKAESMPKSGKPETPKGNERVGSSNKAGVSWPMFNHHDHSNVKMQKP